MVLEAAYTLSKSVLPPKFYVHAGVTGLALLVTYAFSQGRSTSRERDLHARTVLVAGAFTPLGLTIVTNLANRGAHVIALSDYPLSHPQPSLLVPLLRTTTNNEEIYAEHADLSSPESIRAFCTKFLTGEDQRLDAIVFAHEYPTLGSLFGTSKYAEEKREQASLATFLLITLLLPAVLVAPVERDIRIINVVNPFYAAAAPTFTKSVSALFSPETAKDATIAKTKDSLFVKEGYRALRTVVVTRHLQRVLNALPKQADEKKDSNPSDTVPAIARMAPSNIIATSVCPGITRSDTMTPLLSADRDSGSNFGVMLYIIMYPLLFLFTKSTNAAVQSVLHVLFLPTPFKKLLAQMNAAADPGLSAAQASEKKASQDDLSVPEEVLKPGALYRECSVVTIRLPSLAAPGPPEGERKEKVSDESKSKGKKPESAAEKESDLKKEVLELEDDDEYGGEVLGRMVWEWYEKELKAWEAKEKSKADQKKAEEENVMESPNHPQVVVTPPTN
ncbi:hypothetical protein ABKN59_006180 [Abortiporus biennis]